MQPGELINPSATIYEIPSHEWLLDFTQTQALANFKRDAKRPWNVRRMKADSISYWSIEYGGTAIVELALSTALRLARETER